MPAQGTCLCEGITLLVPGTDARNTRICFCNHCRKNSGFFCQLTTAVKKPELRIYDPQNLQRTLELKDTESGNPKYKHFCSGCGITLFTEPTVRNDIYYVRTSFFDEGVEQFDNVAVGLRDGYQSEYAKKVINMLES